MPYILYDETLEQLLLSREILILVFIKQHGVEAAGEQLQKFEVVLSPSDLCLINYYEGRGARDINLTCLFISIQSYQ